MHTPALTCAVALALACGLSSGCEIFLPEDWGLRGWPCNDDSQCRGGTWCYKGNCAQDEINICDDGVVDPSEDCDSGGVYDSCEALGLGAGTPNCHPKGHDQECTYDVTPCSGRTTECIPGTAPCPSDLTCATFRRPDTDVVVHRCANRCASNSDCRFTKLRCTFAPGESGNEVGPFCALDEWSGGHGAQCDDSGLLPPCELFAASLICQAVEIEGTGHEVCVEPCPLGNCTSSAQSCTSATLPEVDYCEWNGW